MSAEVSVYGRIRGLNPDNFQEGSEQQARLNSRGEIILAQGLPPEAEVARLGQSYVCMGSAVAPVAALPTTAAHLSLWNGEIVGGKSYIISAVGSLCTTTVAAAASASLLAHLGTAAEANPAGALVIKGMSGKIYRGQGNAKASVTIANSGVWHPVGPCVQTANTANIGIGVYQDVYGRYIVPPGQIFSLATINATAAGAFAPFIIWHEAQLILG